LLTLAASALGTNAPSRTMPLAWADRCVVCLPNVAERHLGLFVERDRRRRVERNEVPDQLRAVIRKASFLDERQRRVGAIDLEAVVAPDPGREPDVVQDGSDRDHFLVAVQFLHLPDPCSEQP
jgi:hypothetical protein